MQAWWVCYSHKDSKDYILRNSLGVYVAVVKEEHELRWVLNDKSDSFKESLTVEQAKNIVAHKFATMLAEQAVAVLTIGA